MAGDFPDNPEQLTEEQLRAAYEQEIKRVRVEHVLLENVVTMVNLGMRRTGLMPGTEDERDLAQVQLAIDSVRALLPQIEPVAPEQADCRSGTRSRSCRWRSCRPAAAASEAPGRAAEPGSRATAARSSPDGPGPAQQSGRLWVPGQ